MLRVFHFVGRLCLEFVGGFGLLCVGCVGCVLPVRHCFGLGSPMRGGFIRCNVWCV